MAAPAVLAIGVILGVFAPGWMDDGGADVVDATPEPTAAPEAIEDSAGDEPASESSTPAPQPTPSSSEEPTMSPVAAGDADPTPAVADPVPEATPAPPAPSGIVRLAADHDFVVAISGKSYSQLQTRRGIELPAGDYVARFTCMACPDATLGQVTRDVTVRAGETGVTRVEFPAKP